VAKIGTSVNASFIIYLFIYLFIFVVIVGLFKCPINHCLCDTLLHHPDFQNKSYGFTIYKDPFGVSQQNSPIQNHFHLIVQGALLLNFYPFRFTIFTYSLSLLSFCLICIFSSYASWIPPVSYWFTIFTYSLSLLSFCLIWIFSSYASFWIPLVSYCISSLRVSPTWREILAFHFACFSSPHFLQKLMIFKSYKESCLALGFY
jgi:hypothetical protein